MKKLIILPCVNGQIYNYLRALSSKYIEISDNKFLYMGCCDPLEKVSYIIKEYRPTDFRFYETNDYYVFRV